MADTGKIICSKCLHYHVTWEPENPYGCRAYGFKTPYVPSSVVQRISGMVCQQFTPKTDRK